MVGVIKMNKQVQVAVKEKVKKLLEEYDIRCIH